MIRGFNLSRRQSLGLMAGAGVVSATAPLSVFARQPGTPPVPPEAFPGLDLLVEEARSAWRVPGFAFAIIRDGRVIHAKGYGTTSVASGSPITPATPFGIASVSKMVTAASVAIGVDRGLVSWDDPVRTWLPGFRTSGGAAYDSISLRDMLSHRTGLPRHDLLWYNNAALTRSKLLAHLPHLAMTAPLRAQYQYNNIMVILAAHALEAAAGTAWEDFTNVALLGPAGMTGTRYSPAGLTAADGHAAGHRLDTARRPEALPLHPDDAVGPAGALWTTLDDFTRFVRLQLGRGELEGRRIISAANTAAMWQPLVPTDGASEQPLEDRAFYGMGWRIDSYRGMTRVAHGGNLNGFSSRVTLFPERNIGMVAFANMRGNPMPGHVTLDVMDRLMGLEPENHSAGAITRRNAAEARAAASPPAPPPRVASTRPSRPPAEYAGTFSDPGYGPITVTATPEGLSASYNAMPMALEHWHYDVFRAKSLGLDDGDLDGLRFNFITDDDGAIAAVSVKMDDEAPPVVFSRAP